MASVPRLSAGGFGSSFTVFDGLSFLPPEGRLLSRRLLSRSRKQLALVLMLTHGGQMGIPLSDLLIDALV